MNFQLECVTCHAMVWVRGNHEPDTNAVVLNENDPMEGACEHIANGGDYEIVDEEQIFDEE